MTSALLYEKTIRVWACGIGKIPLNVIREDMPLRVLLMAPPLGAAELYSRQKTEEGPSVTLKPYSAFRLATF